MLSTISHMVCGSTWECDAQLVKAPSITVLRSGCFHVATAKSKQAGDVAVIHSRGRAQFVVIVDELLRPAVRAIAQSLEANPVYSTGCWHALRLWHRSRRMGIREAMSESWASILARMWNPTQGPVTGVLIDRLRLHINGYRGLTSDEHIVDLVAKHLPSLRPYRAHRSVTRGPHAQHGHDSSALFIARSEQDPNTSALGAVMLQSEVARAFAAETPWVPQCP